jgi:tetratricopeptide (TPR) repeat protein
MNLAKLKENARRFELQAEWRKAIDTYLQAAQDLGESGHPVDPSLYNRIGDLEMKVGGLQGALRAYEQAADLYADQGFFNNAIALCGKILRVHPSRIPTYLRLAELHARKNVVGEARRNLLEYVERMSGGGKMPEALTELRIFADRFAASQEIRQMLSELLRTSPGEAAREHLEELAGGLDTPHPAAPAPPTRGLVFIDTGIEIPGLPGSWRAASPEPGTGSEESPAIAFFEPTAVGESAGIELVPDAVAGLEPTQLSTPNLRAEVLPPLVTPPIFEPQVIEGLEAIQAFAPPAEGSGIEALTLEQPSTPARRPGEELFDELEEETPFGVADLEHMLTVYESDGHWDEAGRVADELIRLDPGRLERYQKRVELSYRAGDPRRLVEAYLALAAVLARSGARSNALMVYQRVLDHDPINPVAVAALATLRPPPGAPTALPAPDPADADPGYVDLAALILEPEPERDTRMRVDPVEPVGDEDKDFLETLGQFMAGIEANLTVEDFQAHYDLGIAFREMGLLDEAIAHFQKALRAPEGRLKSSEALGSAFFDQGRLAIAEAVLSRAVKGLPGADDEKIGLIYWLGRACEAQGKSADALRLYERVLAVDIRFLDLSDRIQRLTAGQGA